MSRLNPMAVPIKTLIKIKAESAGRLGSGNPHNQVTQRMVKSVKALSSGGRLAVGFMIFCQPSPLNANINNWAASSNPNPSMVRRACGNSLNRQWLNADWNAFAIE